MVNKTKFTSSNANSLYYPWMHAYICPRKKHLHPCWVFSLRDCCRISEDALFSFSHYCLSSEKSFGLDKKHNPLSYQIRMYKRRQILDGYKHYILAIIPTGSLLSGFYQLKRTESCGPWMRLSASSWPAPMQLKIKSAFLAFYFFLYSSCHLLKKQWKGQAENNLWQNKEWTK